LPGTPWHNQGHPVPVPGARNAPPSSDLEEELQQEAASAIRIALFDGILIDSTIEKGM
jgi:hypothetical protein